MLNHHFYNCHKSIRETALFALPFLVGVALLACCISPDAEASLFPRRTIESPRAPGWQIDATGSMCAARQSEENGQRITLLADERKYRGGVWYLDVVSRNQRLQPGVREVAARLFLDGKPVATGKALDVGDSAGDKRTATYVRIEFLAIDAHIKAIEAARVVEVQADGLSRLQLGSLSQIIYEIVDCQIVSKSPDFWK